ncbi:flagellar basal body P-ring protein FlgI [Burkholderia sp. AU42008]|uniref:flagellar basal body P-ring protein FlgI n=1 Tax=unclassified Burkholderia TaxID=2613784 RepID=UPI0015C5DDDA|nr:MULTISPECIES: flagellar basal body P-ring protein FlgI [unclassified Burkholderia]MBR8238325.1 flagellar basal body P-ring protein FlgI [Burkholderia sp. AU32357]MBY4877518.1 flagellar basal body P-ring protein FlgI [Burkholderia sp. AU42008]
MKPTRLTIRVAALAIVIGIALSNTIEARAQTVGSLVDVEGVRENALVGYGIVVGLAGSGDGTQAKYTTQSLTNMLKQFGTRLPENINLRSRNAAAVIVSATFPPGYRRGQKVDVTVSSLGDAKSLRGGTLLMTPLRAADGDVYALAQGNLVIPGLNVQGRSGTSVTINTPTTGRIPKGATIEREIATDFADTPTVRLNLKRPDFQTASSITDVINNALGSEVASTVDATSVDVVAPQVASQRVAFVARLNALKVSKGAEVPRVVFNSRTGTVVISQGVTVKPAVVSHGSLKVTIAEGTMVSQPNAFANGSTVTAPVSEIGVTQAGGNAFQWTSGASLQAIVDTITRTGATPDDLMAILQALSEAGALTGDLVVI